MPYLIDGHNLIARLPDISLQDPDDEAKLVHKIRSFSARSGKRCVIVFDSGLPGGRSTMSNRAVEVIFASAHHTTADALIKRRIHQARDKKQWRVVTADNDIINYVRHQGGSVIPTDDFVDLLEMPVPQSDPDGNAIDQPISAEEVDEWLAVFRKKAK